jgi:hypothetical protein
MSSLRKTLHLTSLSMSFLVMQNISAGESMEQKLKTAMTFEVDYAKSMDMDKINASFSKGKATGTLILGEKADFDFEPMSTVNNGLKIGANCTSIQYETAGNLTSVKGSIEMVVKNLNWDWNDNKIHLFMQTNKIPANGVLMYIYKHAIM